ncbi:hypothetical protein J8986_00030, partial [Bacteroides thetaiotaomicron]|uniref:hypothetical protein n=1 Tax=Bacteroides thetaiotaomicron TaxID=818 RepID=UPI001F3E2A0F
LILLVGSALFNLMVEVGRVEHVFYGWMPFLTPTILLDLTSWIRTGVLPSIRWESYQLPTLTSPSLGRAGNASLTCLEGTLVAGVTTSFLPEIKSCFFTLGVREKENYKIIIFIQGVPYTDANILRVGSAHRRLSYERNLQWGILLR